MLKKVSMLGVLTVLWLATNLYAQCNTTVSGPITGNYPRTRFQLLPIKTRIDDIANPGLVTLLQLKNIGIVLVSHNVPEAYE